jgi:cytoskeletal protein CcmA (bactofilin family)
MSKEEINAFLGAATVYTGKLSFQGAVRIDGVFNGEIESDGVLIVGKDACVEGHLRVKELVLSGNFSGDIKAAYRVTIHKTGVLTGHLQTKALILEEGATLEGEVHMRDEDEVMSLEA